MLKKEDNKIKIPNLSNNKYIPFNNGNKIFIRHYKLFFSFLLLFLLVFIIILFINNERIYNNNIKVTLSNKSLFNGKNEQQFFKSLRLILDKDEILINELMNNHTTFELGGQAKNLLYQNQLLFR